MIDESLVQRALSAALVNGGDFAEVFVEDRRSSSATLDDGKVEDLTSGRDRGAGVRVVRGERTGFAHTSDLSEQGLLAAAQAAAGAARFAGGAGGAGAASVVPLSAAADRSALTVAIQPAEVAKSAKVELLRRAEAAARDAGGAIRQVAVTVADSRRQILVASSDGLLARDDQVRTRFSVSCVALGDTGLQTGRESIGLAVGWELFDRLAVDDVARKAAARALTKLRARPAPTGAMPVVLAAGSGGILFHEACGHGLEKDLVDKGASVFAGRVGQQVASPLVTLVDDGTLAGEWGYASIDDEGRPAARHVLIERGVLTDYLWDRLRAAKAGRPGSANGRRETYRNLPMVRMTNTFIENGSGDADAIVADTERGVYVAQLGGGQVNTASGDFVFGMTEAYLIEGGRITEPLREANLIGNGPNALAAIDALAADFEMGGPGTCGKDGQGVPVGTGTPTLRVQSLTIGGTAA
ncbi:MAG: TldD/PmbA family protein [Acidimicrobiales bacterium]